MNLYEELSPKQRRTVARDLNVILSLKGLSFPKTIDEIKEIGFFSPRIKVYDKEIYLSENGRIALRRICDFTHQSNKFKDLLNYNDVFKCVLSEIERWISSGSVPDAYEFIVSLDDLLSESIREYSFVCKVDGISFDKIASIRIGRREVKNYSNATLDGIINVSDSMRNTIDEEYGGGLILAGSENGSESVAMEKFYHNAELSLSILRLYSCALSSHAIHKVNVRLINNCSHSYGSASCFGWDELEQSLIFTRYFKSEQDISINSELLEYFGNSLFFDELSRLIDEGSKDELGNAIIKSLYWIGEAQKDRSYPSAWVKLWSALECFFTLGEDEITERNARGISSILLFGGFNHDQYDDYEQVKKKVKKYYKLRSKIVHHAEYSHIDEIQLEEMSFIVAWVIIVMVSLLKRGYTLLSEIADRAESLDKAHKENSLGLTT